MLTWAAKYSRLTSFETGDLRSVAFKTPNLHEWGWSDKGEGSNGVKILHRIARVYMSKALTQSFLPRSIPLTCSKLKALEMLTDSRNQAWEYR